MLKCPLLVSVQSHVRCLLPALTLSCSVGTGIAQDAPVIRTGTVEAGGFVGASYGVDKARVMGGGNVVYSLTRVVMPFAEVSYFPGIGRTVPVSGLPGAQTTFSIPITDFNAGVHIRVPIPKSRVIPYGLISIGGIRSPARRELVQIPDPFRPGVTTPLPLDFPASTQFVVSGGAGLRFYATERWGFRGEFKAYRPRSAESSNVDFISVFYRVAGGFFYQF